MKRSNQKLEALAVGALLDAESRVVRSNAAAMLEASGLMSSDFTNKTLADCLVAIFALNERKRPIDAKTVWSWGSAAGIFNDSTLARLEALATDNACTREIFIEHSEQLRRLTKLRRLESFHRSQLASLDAERADPTTLATQCSEFLSQFTTEVEPDETGAHDMARVVEDWAAFMAGERSPVIATGIEVIDTNLGGFVPNLNILGGLPSVGKSALVAEIIMCCLDRGENVGLFGLEDGTEWVSRRHLARAMGMPVGAIGRTRLHRYQQETLERQSVHLGKLQHGLQVYRRAGIEPEAMLAKAKHWIANKGVRFIIIDHGGEVRHQTPDGNRDRNDLAVANTYRQLRDLAVNHRVPILVLCHFNRGTEQHGKPTPKSFAETAYIERMARVALGLWEVESEPDYLRCTVLKCTEGARGYTMRIRRDAQHALVHRMGGDIVDEAAEAQAKQKKQEKAPW